MTGPLDLEGIDPELLIDVTAFVSRRAATDFVLLHHLTTAIGIPSRWFLDTATMASDLVRDLQRVTTKETP